MSRRTGPGSAFTLIELLISVTLTLAITAAAFAAFRQIQVLINKANIRVEMHQTALFVNQRLSADLMTMNHATACFAESKPASAPGDEDATVRLVFMHGKMSPSDFTMAGNYGNYYYQPVDHAWTQWLWNQKRRELSRGTHDRFRRWTMSKNWIEPSANRNFLDFPFATIPQPRRTAGAVVPPAAVAAILDPPDGKSIAAGRLSDNQFMDYAAFGSAATRSPEDYGDWYWLQQDTVPVMKNVVGLTLQAVLVNGATLTWDGATERYSGIDGVQTDGENAAALGSRPKLFRMLITCRDAEADITQHFTFSFPTPAMLPQP